jgi:hypothetical protein
MKTFARSPQQIKCFSRKQKREEGKELMESSAKLLMAFLSIVYVDV